jgi:hypothetical protein
MGCGCKGGGTPSRRPTIAPGKMLGMLQTTQKVNSLTANTQNIMPPAQLRSASGEDAEKRKTQKIRRDAIRRALGK